MAEKSWLWGGTSVGDAALASPDGAPYSDDMFTDMLNALINFDRRTTGVIISSDPRYSGMFKATVSGGSSIIISPGAAMVDGKLYVMDASQTFNLPSNGTYQIVLRKDFNAQTVRMVFRQGSTVTQVDSVVWEIELYRINFVFGMNGIFEVADKRRFLPASHMVLLDQITVGYQNTYDQTVQFNFDSAWPFSILRVEWSGASATDTSGATTYFSDMQCRFNGDSSALYHWTYSVIKGRTSTLEFAYLYGQSAATCGKCGTGSFVADGWLELKNWNTNDTMKVGEFNSLARATFGAQGLGGSYAEPINGWMGYTNNLALSSIKLFHAAVPNNPIYQGRFRLYGIL